MTESRPFHGGNAGANPVGDPRIGCRESIPQRPGWIGPRHAPGRQKTRCSEAIVITTNADPNASGSRGLTLYKRLPSSRVDPSAAAAIGFLPRQYLAAMVSFTMATRAAFSSSARANSRPDTKGMPIVAKAIEKDPEYALAYAGVADSYAVGNGDYLGTDRAGRSPESKSGGDEGTDAGQLPRRSSYHASR